MNELITIDKLSKNYLTLKGKIYALDNISFKVYESDIIAIVGQSGCGKSTLLNIIDNIDKDYTGNISIKYNNISYMLQSDCLLPWLTIYQNITLPNKFNKEIDYKYIDELLNKYDLYEFKDKYPNSLSGGMKQRVALIRTLATRPKILLLDEPFSALDYQTRLLIENDVYNIVKENNITMIIVTHDISEAISIANKVIVLSKRPGRIKTIININLDNNTNPIDNRKDNKFNYYFDIIWKELNND